jgi:restriction endonuclease Mrr
MTIPHDHIIQFHLLKMLDGAPQGTMHCNDAYVELSRLFPNLDKRELTESYRSGKSKWVNRVQWAREHLAMKGFILRPGKGGERGYWTISQVGRNELHHPIDIGI